MSVARQEAAQAGAALPSPRACAMRKRPCFFFSQRPLRALFLLRFTYIFFTCRALATDTGGSVRLPASYCGVVGLKPSYGLVSRWGVVSFADSLDCVGVIGKDVASTSKIFGSFYCSPLFQLFFYIYLGLQTFSLCLTREIPPPPGQRRAKELVSCVPNT